MHKLGVRKVYFFGIIVTALCAIAFGALDFVQDKTTFLVLSYMLRIFEGMYIVHMYLMFIFRQTEILHKTSQINWDMKIKKHL